jgi:hypothetical protein
MFQKIPLFSINLVSLWVSREIFEKRKPSKYSVVRQEKRIVLGQIFGQNDSWNACRILPQAS